MVVAGFRWIEARLNEASARVAAAERQVITTTELANREVVAARQDADRQIAEARQLAQRAETVGVILTAPDLIRFNLTSGETVGPSAQLLWSRTRGLVLSGSRLPAAPPKSTYQLWLVTSTQSVGAGLFVPDDAGRATSWSMRHRESSDRSSAPPSPWSQAVAGRRPQGEPCSHAFLEPRAKGGSSAADSTAT